jgi:hypothetical protein
LGLSGLASQRFEYKHIDDPKCQKCNAKVEDPAHYFLACPAYKNCRVEFLAEVCHVLQINGIEVNLEKKYSTNFLINTILRGSPILNDLDNGIIFIHTQEYIKRSQRFP